MSAWDPYIDTMKKSGLQVCAIYGREGGVWAKSAEWNPTQAEIVDVVKNIHGKNFPDGVHLNGVKYTVISMSEDSVTGKCRNAPTDAEKYLMHVALAKTCLVIGGIAGGNERSCTKHVEDIRDYLVKAGY